MVTSPGPERPLHEMLRSHARTHPDKPAFIWYGRTLTYAQIDDATEAFAARLLALGLRKGEPVAIYMGNCPQYVLAHYGVQKAGGIVCPCGPLYKQHELEYQLSDLGARFIVAAHNLVPVVNAVKHKTAIERVFVVNYADLLLEQPTPYAPEELVSADRGVTLQEREESFLSAAFSGSRAPHVDVAMDDVGLITYTSGTTGMPKGAMLTHRNALFKCSAFADCNGLSESDVALWTSPLNHIAGMMMMYMVLFKGATSVMFHRFEPNAVAAAIEKYRVSFWHSMAPMNIAILDLPNIAKRDLSSLRRNPSTSFGIILTEQLANRFREHANNCTTYESTYGLSETHGPDTHMPVDAIRWGTHGRALPGAQIRITDSETGRDMPIGDQGEIVLKSAGIFTGYWNKAEATQAAMRDGWLRTGDVGRLDADGYLTFTGRTKEMIKVSGYAVFPEEVESILIKHPAVGAAAVIGVPDQTKGELIRAFIVLKKEHQLSANDLIAWSRENMSTYKAPREVRFLDSLPMTGAGKVLRRLLKDAA